MNNTILNMLRQANNPQVLATELLRRNPQMSQMLQGKNPKDVAMEIMRRQGINVEELMQTLQSFIK